MAGKMSRPVKKPRLNNANNPISENNPNGANRSSNENRPSSANWPIIASNSSGLQNSASGGVQSAIRSKRLDENRDVVPISPADIFSQSNLKIEVVSPPKSSKEAAMEQLANKISEHLGPTIVYCWKLVEFSEFIRIPFRSTVILFFEIVPSKS